MPLESISRKKIGDEVFDQIKNEISSGGWNPGDKIPSETDLAKMLGVSRMSVRDALQRLTSIGIVERRQGEGTFICRFDGGQYLNAMIPMMTLQRVDLESLFEFRGMIECESARLAALRADETVVKALRENIERMVACADDVQAAADCDFDFHMLLAEATRNPMLVQIYGILKDIIVQSLIQVKARIGSEPGLEYHRLLADAVEAHDAEHAREIMWEHMSKTVEILKK